MERKSYTQFEDKGGEISRGYKAVGDGRGATGG